MKITLNIEEAFGAIDYDNAGGLISYLDVALTEKFYETPKIKIINFILNTIDDPIIEQLTNQVSSAIPERIINDGFILVKSALIEFEELDRLESEISIQTGDSKHTTQNSWGRKLQNNDKIYDLGGRLLFNPNISIKLCLITSKKIKLTYSTNDAVLIDSYTNLTQEIEKANQEMKNKTSSTPATLFDIEVIKNHTKSDSDKGYNIYFES
ncbi:hypothetical protein [Pseudomonas chlororaphis]|uniref:hypothetical protein n=1 Tax=Pseudomonas chlororaphis TaxID=587753 RepID=UPI000F57F8DE|nr:hypothetical protein [Pseudomonas chlororaphis]AZD70631.1 hypothetical protein C4K16_0240 [Pseudomonas chlororaphis subsp. aurantiaca]AZD76833.1 hypothetical protein C4K15_0235 [Pseudomonas chlororaphis subsp. aurantiaca]QLL13743.1 hypothetical protein H0I86_01230 [Pseudomonas chlororaphis subsp. aurantiaca]